MNMITLGNGQRKRQFDVNLEGQIPDLWHIAQAELDLHCRRSILETWHLAHDLQKALAEIVPQRDELLKALEGLFEHCAMIHKHWGEGCNRKEAGEAQAFALAAIAKAKGETV